MHKTSGFQYIIEDIMKKSLALLALFLFACPPSIEVTPMPMTVPDSDACAPACTRLEQLGCEEGKPIVMRKSCNTGCKDGQFCMLDAGKCATPCVRFCLETQLNGVFLDPVCISRITSCDQVNQCPTTIKK